jgi:riboflavin synthase
LKCVGVVDTTFARVDMARYVIEVFERELSGYKIVRHTVPGIKDLPAAARRIIDLGCDGVITLGWVGPGQVDKYSYLASSIGLVMLGVMTGKVIIDVTVHEDEAERPEDLKRIAVHRAKAHAENLVAMLKGGLQALTPKAGMGVRQGYPDVGPIG